MKAVGIGILRDALDGGDFLNALRKSLRVGREDQKQRGTRKSEVGVSTHRATFDPGFGLCLQDTGIPSSQAVRYVVHAPPSSEPAPRRSEERRVGKECRSR